MQVPPLHSRPGSKGNNCETHQPLSLSWISFSHPAEPGLVVVEVYSNTTTLFPDSESLRTMLSIARYSFRADPGRFVASSAYSHRLSHILLPTSQAQSNHLSHTNPSSSYFLRHRPSWRFSRICFQINTISAWTSWADSDINHAELPLVALYLARNNHADEFGFADSFYRNKVRRPEQSMYESCPSIFNEVHASILLPWNDFREKHVGSPKSSFGPHLDIHEPANRKYPSIRTSYRRRLFSLKSYHCAWFPKHKATMDQCLDYQVA